MHRELSERTDQLDLPGPITVAVLSTSTGVTWAQHARITAGTRGIPNAAALVRRRIAAQLRSPHESVFGACLSGVLRHDRAYGHATAVYLVDGSVAAVRDSGEVSAVTGDWTRVGVNWGIPPELAAGLENTPGVRSPLIGFAEALGVPYEHRSTEGLTLSLCTASAAEPNRAASYGVDVATAALLPELVSHSSDLVDILTGRFDPWESSSPAAFLWPQALEAVAS
jgi:hypothetical protein